MAILYRNKILAEDIAQFGVIIDQSFLWTQEDLVKIEVLKKMISSRMDYARVCGYSWNVVNAEMLGLKFKDFIYRYNQIVLESTELKSQGLMLKSFINPQDKYTETRDIERDSTNDTEYGNETESNGSSSSDNQTIEEMSPVNNNALFEVTSPSSKENYKDNSSSSTTTNGSGSRNIVASETVGEDVTKSKQYFEYFYRAYNAMIKNANVMYIIDSFVKPLIYEMNSIW